LAPLPARGCVQGAPVFLLGRLVVQRGHIAFHPGEALFQAQAGSRADLALAWAFDEASHAKEGLHLRLAITLDGKDLGSKEDHVRDTPLVQDEIRGTLALPAQFGPSGEVEGAFTVEARYEQGPWGKGPGQSEAFRHQGRFRTTLR
jgi:hypothetical protein